MVSKLYPLTSTFIIRYWAKFPSSVQWEVEQLSAELDNTADG